MGKGFFDFEDVDLKLTKPQPKKKVTTRTVRKTPKSKKPELPPCEECGAYRTCKSPKMGVTGEGKTGILYIGEAHGRREDEEGYQFCGSAGQLFRKQVLEPLGYDLDTDFYKINSVRCFTHDEKGRMRNPENKEITLCHAGTWEIIKELKPKAIIIAGRVPLQSYMLTLDISGEKPAISQWADWAIPDRELGCWVIPQYHPSYFQYGTNNRLLNIYRLKMGKAIENALRPFPTLTQEEDKVECLTYNGDIIPLLKRIYAEKPPLLTLDWETTGLKPFVKGHEIVAVGLSWNPEHGVAFPLSEEVLPYLLPILKSSRIRKTAHNFKFEELWARIILGTEITNLTWCSQLAAHVLDDRHGITSLEFQAFVRYGVLGFKDETSPYMKTETANGFNRVKECPLDKLLLRNALDSMLSHRLALDQMKELKQEQKLPSAYKFFHAGSLALLDCEIRGMRASSEVFNKAYETISTESAEVKERVLNSYYAKLWEKKTGTELNPGSAPQLKKLLFEFMGIEPLKLSAKGNPTLDKADIEEYARILTQPSLKNFLHDVTQLRSSTKTESTYIKGIIREIHEDMLHPFFHLHKVRSFRSCIAKGTKVLAVRDFLKYPDGVPIEKIRTGDLVYCFDNDLNPAIRRVRWAGKTGTRKVIRLHWRAGRGRRGYVDVTPEHLVRHISGEYIQAQALTGDLRTPKENKKAPKIRVLSCSRKGDQLRFTGHMPPPRNCGLFEHRFIYESLVGPLLPSDLVHHKDGIHLNHDSSNLEKTTGTEHARLHCPFTPESRRKGDATRRKKWANGEYAELSKLMSERARLNLSAVECLRRLCRFKGHIAKAKQEYDFVAFKNCLLRHGIDYKLVKIRYDKNGEYITRRRLSRLLDEQGLSRTSKIIGHNHYRLKHLCELLNLPFRRKWWGNQFGRQECVYNNHEITGITVLHRPREVYDLEVEEFNNFFANEVCVHNSSSRPNLQNIPARDERMMNLVRSGLFPHEGQQLLEVDFNTHEVRVSANGSQDPELIRYCTDPTTDMHRDQTERLYLVSREQINKPLRNLVKGAFVFAEFYGSWFQPCAENLWKSSTDLVLSDGTPVHEHLKNKGISSLEVFTEHVKAEEEQFWKKFAVHAKWKEAWARKYYKTGRVPLAYGFRRQGFLARNEVLNTPIQGTAFHLLLWSLIEINNFAKKEGWRSQVIGQIHDCILLSVQPDELFRVASVVHWIMTEHIMQQHSWLTVPLDIEYELCEIDAPWSTKKKIAYSEFLNGYYACK